jgi:excinuclease ABC subunit A
VKTADWVIDLGPEGGSGGGFIVCEGTPEEVAAHPTSYTGQFLAPLLKGAAPGQRSPARAADAKAKKATPVSTGVGGKGASGTSAKPIKEIPLSNNGLADRAKTERPVIDRSEKAKKADKAKADKAVRDAKAAEKLGIPVGTKSHPKKPATAAKR